MKMDADLLEKYRTKNPELHNACQKLQSSIIAQIEAKSDQLTEKINSLEIGDLSAEIIAGVQYNVKFQINKSNQFVDVGIFQKLTDKGSKFKVTSIAELENDNALQWQAELKRVWKILDENDDNEIDIHEFEKFMLSEVITSRVNKLKYWQIKAVFDVIDRDKSGSVDFEEFATLIKRNDKNELVLRLPLNYPYKELNQAWNAVDTNQDGVISFQEFLRFMKKDGFSKNMSQGKDGGDGPTHLITEERCHRMFYVMDSNKDQKVDFNEFVKFLKQGKDGKFTLNLDKFQDSVVQVWC